MMLDHHHQDHTLNFLGAIRYWKSSSGPYSCKSAALSVEPNPLTFLWRNISKYIHIHVIYKLYTYTICPILSCTILYYTIILYIVLLCQITESRLSFEILTVLIPIGKLQGSCIVLRDTRNENTADTSKKSRYGSGSTHQRGSEYRGTEEMVQEEVMNRKWSTDNRQDKAPRIKCYAFFQVTEVILQSGYQSYSCL